jgi:hypothetical protein
VNILNVSHVFAQGLRFIPILTYLRCVVGSSSLQKDKLTGWLHSPDPLMTHNQLQDEHQAGMGLWFFESGVFRNWLDTPCATMWIQGICEYTSPSTYTVLRPM